jgi:hypothetical protein
MNGTAPAEFAAWLSTHEHIYNQYGFVYRYHPRSDAHSKALCRFIVEDLLVASPTLRAQAEADRVVYGINCLYEFPASKKIKTLDLVIARGRPDNDAERIGGAIAPARQTGQTILVGNRKVKELDIGRVIISCESKATMTEHSKSMPRIFELSSSHEIVHQGDPDAIAAGVLVQWKWDNRGCSSS